MRDTVIVTAESIKKRLIAKGFSTSPGLLAETIYAYVLDERERCAKRAEEMHERADSPVDAAHLKECGKKFGWFIRNG